MYPGGAEDEGGAQLGLDTPVDASAAIGDAGRVGLDSRDGEDLGGEGDGLSLIEAQGDEVLHDLGLGPDHHLAPDEVG